MGLLLSVYLGLLVVLGAAGYGFYLNYAHSADLTSGRREALHPASCWVPL